MSYDHGTQVGGNHYSKGDLPQHWDLAVWYRWDPFQYQITKYVMRWKDKFPTREKRLEDLKKARNFLDKYIQEVEKGAYDPGDSPITVESVMASKEYLAARQFAQEMEAVTGLRPQAIKAWAEENVIGVSVVAEGAVFLHNDRFLNEGGWGSGVNLYTCKKCRKQVRALTLSAAEAEHPTCDPT